jgi:hypothetical protein
VLAQQRRGAGMSASARTRSHSARGRCLKAASISGVSASALSRRASQEPNRGSSMRSSRASTLQSLAQNDWLPQARNSHSPSWAWYIR